MNNLFTTMILTELPPLNAKTADVAPMLLPEHIGSLFGPTISGSCMFNRVSEDAIALETAAPAHFVNGVSPAMRALTRVIADIAPTEIPVLLVGESGTGKEAVALEIHRCSRRHREVFQKCNCATATFDSLPTTLPTDRQRTRSANGSTGNGTIFLTEIGQLEPANQNRLLHLLPDGDRVPAGPYLDARVISASTQDLEDEMRHGRFREDLYYQLNGVCLRLPSLRDRREDIPLLLAFFLKKYAALLERSEPELEPATLQLLQQHSWPGNVRELENMARKIVALGDEHLALSDLSAKPVTTAATPAVRSAAVVPRPAGRSLKEAAREASRKAERELISIALERTHWNRKRTARELQISYKALLYKLKQLNLDGASDS